ncbi:MAG TPA: hypothetical protein VFS58_17355 [Steroidobacteraceae bacterium]|nr:hypothetical protein [Steroidobacteraceae bacterium]
MEQTLANPASTRSHAASPLLAEGVAAVFTVLLLPVCLYAANLAPVGRLLYPAANFLLAGYLFSRRSPWYAAHCLLAFCCVSLVRRLVDDQAGFDASNPVLLTPYLCCLYTVISFFEYWSRPNPRKVGAFLVLLTCIVYGTGLAMLDGRFRSSLVDVLKWSVGPLFAVYLLAHRESIPELRRIFEPCLIGAAVVMSLYGMAQFASPASWDATWMRGVAELGFDSIGRPEPFQLRVFSTMNSPGAFGAILSAGIVLALKRRLPVCLACVAPMLVGLALCQYRSLWAATSLAIVLVAVAPSAGVRRTNILALFLAGLVLASTALSPQIRDTVFQRASTLTELEGDESLRKRLNQYSEFLSHDNLIVGDGLAINGASRRLDNRAGAEIDGALIEVYRAMGVFVGTTFILAIAALVAGLFRAAPAAGGHIYYDRAIVVALFVQFPIGTVHVGELGFCAWAFLGFGLAARVAAQENA